MIKTLFSRALLVMLVALFAAPLRAGDSAPEQLIRQTADEVLAIIKQRNEEFKKEPSKMYQMVDDKVLPHFDFDRMTDLALGRYRRDVTAAQKPELVDQFRRLLVRTYGKALLEYNDETIKYLPMRGDLAKGEVSVRTEIEQKGGFPIPLNYELYLKEGAWKVFDISVDNISLVTNYRSSFAKRIKQDGVDGLIKALQSRNREES
jgi:phospholipid transport system substrate-binding protein